jgi:hypothetical protein
MMGVLVWIYGLGAWLGVSGCLRWKTLKTFLDYLALFLLLDILVNCLSISLLRTLYMSSRQS